jgi:hypothetical protein
MTPNWVLALAIVALCLHVRFAHGEPLDTQFMGTWCHDMRMRDSDGKIVGNSFTRVASQADCKTWPLVITPTKMVGGENAFVCSFRKVRSKQFTSRVEATCSDEHYRPHKEAFVIFFLDDGDDYIGVQFEE